MLRHGRVARRVTAPGVTTGPPKLLIRPLGPPACADLLLPPATETDTSLAFALLPQARRLLPPIGTAGSSAWPAPRAWSRPDPSTVLSSAMPTTSSCHTPPSAVGVYGTPRGDTLAFGLRPRGSSGCHAPLPVPPLPKFTKGSLARAGDMLLGSHCATAFFTTAGPLYDRENGLPLFAEPRDGTSSTSMAVTWLSMWPRVSQAPGLHRDAQLGFATRLARFAAAAVYVRHGRQHVRCDLVLVVVVGGAVLPSCANHCRVTEHALLLSWREAVRVAWWCNHHQQCHQQQRAQRRQQAPEARAAHRAMSRG